MNLNNKALEQFQESVNIVSESKIEMSIKITHYYNGIGKNKRHGRFKLDMLEHKILLKRDGYYFFVLLSGNMILGGKVIMAKNVKFKNQIAWPGLVELPKDFQNLESWGV